MAELTLSLCPSPDYRPKLPSIPHTFVVKNKKLLVVKNKRIYTFLREDLEIRLAHDSGWQKVIDFYDESMK